MAGNHNFKHDFSDQKLSKPRSLTKSDLVAAQDTIYNFLIEIVKAWSPDKVLDYFTRLFLTQEDVYRFPAFQAVQEIVLANQKTIFFSTLKRSCYILINNWDTARKHSHIQELVKVLAQSRASRPSLPTIKRRLFSWLNEFAKSPDYQTLELFAQRFEKDKDARNWLDRYTYYLLIPQYEDQNNPTEQRQAARALSAKLRYRFKLDLAMYVAHSQTYVQPLHAQNGAFQTSNFSRQNPTELGDNALSLIKFIVKRRGQFSYKNLAHIFLDQVEDLSYQLYKKSILKYLTFALDQDSLVPQLNQRLSYKLNDLYQDYEAAVINDSLQLRTCNQMIAFLLTEDDEHPSELFSFLLSQGGGITLALLLLKIILISPNARRYLDLRIAYLVRYYQDFPPDDCKWFTRFLDICNITFAIYVEGIEYSLLQTKVSAQDNDPDRLTMVEEQSEFTKKLQAQNLQNYQVFAQARTISDK